MPSPELLVPSQPPASGLAVAGVVPASLLPPPPQAVKTP